MRKICLSLVLVLAGCGTPGYIKASAVEGTLLRVCERHDKWNDMDKSLSPLRKRVNARDSTLLRKLLKEAQKPKDTE